MTSGTNKKRLIGVLAGSAAFALVLAGCQTGGSTDGGGGGDDGAILVGTTDKVVTLDPAGSYDNGSFSVQNQVFAFLLNSPLGSPDVEPDLAESVEFISPTEYQVTPKPGLKFANGNDLTASNENFTSDAVRSLPLPTRTAPPACSTTWTAPTRSTTPRWSST